MTIMIPNYNFTHHLTDGEKRRVDDQDSLQTLCYTLAAISRHHTSHHTHEHKVGQD